MVKLVMTDRSAADYAILLKFGTMLHYGPRNKSQNERRDVEQSQTAMHRKSQLPGRPKTVSFCA